MPSKTYYRKKGLLRSPPELVRWFDSVKNWRNDPEMRSFREQFTMISENADPDWSLFRAKMRGDVTLLREEAKFIMDKLRLKRDDGRPLFAGFDTQMEIGDDGFPRPTISKVLKKIIKKLKPDEATA
jgi:hypothetical protein